METMNTEQQRIAIAEACGWQFIPEYYHGKDQPPEFTTVTPDGRHLCGYYPDYLNDLNAMHDAEKTLDYNQMNRYQNIELSRFMHTGTTWICSATAAQRAEAFLKTLNLWTP